MARFAVELQSRADVAEVLNRVVDVAVSEVPGAEMPGVTIIGRDGAHTPAATDPLVEQIDAQQYATGEGPCLDTASAEPVVRSGDLAWENRWPAFAPSAVEMGVASILAVQMFVDADAEHIAVPLAMHAAVALVASRTEAGLRIALASRDVIGQAKGNLDGAIQGQRRRGVRVVDRFLAAHPSQAVRGHRPAGRDRRTGPARERLPRRGMTSHSGRELRFRGGRVSRVAPPAAP